MRHQGGRRDSKTFAVVDEDCGIPTAVVETFRPFHEGGPLAHSDPRSIYLSMSEYNNKQNYNVYDYNAAPRAEQSQDYSGFEGAPQAFAGQYVSGHGQVPTGLPQQSTGLPLVPAAPESYPHDPTYYGQPYAQHPAAAYLQPGPRQSPEIISWTPQSGQQGTKVIVHFRSVYDFDAPPVALFLVFGQHRCQSTLQKTAQQGTMYQYALTADAPNFTATNSPSPVPLQLLFDDGSIAWESPTLDLGTFTYLDAYYPSDSPQAVTRKRKLSPPSSPRRSPAKRPSTQRLGADPALRAYLPATAPISAAASPFRRPSLPETYLQARRISGPEYTQAAYTSPLTASAAYYGQPGQTTPSLQPAQSPSWGYPQSVASATRSPSVAAVSTGTRTAQLLPSPAANNPPLIRTSTLQSPVTPAPSSSTSQFNPYGMYPANSKAILQIEGELNNMAVYDRWTPAEKDAGRRLVQFRRSQSGSVISATFEPVTLEDRVPNSICVSCIYWEEKRQCYVTSVDTISLLESLVAVRFTVEEKNRIRRNLEGFRPATISKAKQESEDFFKLIMGFPNPKPRNIEKDVKVFPWRILAGALKKIIGKYSASYSSTAGALPGPSTHRASDAGPESRPIASPPSTSSSGPSRYHTYAPSLTTNAYSPHVHTTAPAAGLGIGPSAVGHPDLRLAVPVSAASQTTSWHQPALYTTGVSSAWQYDNYISASPVTGVPGSAQPYQYQQQPYAPLAIQSTMAPETRFVPLQDYEAQHQPTTTS